MESADSSAGKSIHEEEWHSGWYRLAHLCRSPNFNARPSGVAIDLLVVHSISLPPGMYGGSDVFALFTNTLDCAAHPYYDRLRGVRVSAHFYIRRDGSLWQFVDCDQRAWHAGHSHYRGRSDCNDDSIGVELEGLEGEAFEAPQYRCLAALCGALKARYPITHLAGHSDIAPDRKLDPGPGFDWHSLKTQLPDWADSAFPSQTRITK